MFKTSFSKTLGLEREKNVIQASFFDPLGLQLTAKAITNRSFDQHIDAIDEENIQASSVRCQKCPDGLCPPPIQNGSPWQ